uniref:Uncharacterized protein n=1 Tax=Rhizophora mucronata TaxID=61149 RepID=A0A2P2P5B0_RHIMU
MVYKSICVNFKIMYCVSHNAIRNTEQLNDPKRGQVSQYQVRSFCLMSTL